MKRCLFTYQPLADNEQTYSAVGLKALDRRLTKLRTFPYSRKAQLQEAQRLATKLSIQGVQPKLSAKLNVAAGQFEIVESGGTFIIKPPTDLRPQLPENEDLTMHLAKICNIEVPWHGLILCEDGTYSYAIKRFDRLARGVKVPLEDFSQIIGATRDTKYDVPMEQCADALFEHCTYPTLEMVRLFQRIIFSFLIGNEDLHLKNLSLLTKSRKTALSPAYDLLNSSIVMSGSQEELALSLNEKTSGFTRKDFVQDFALKNQLLNQKVADKVIDELIANLQNHDEWIDISFLSDDQKAKYSRLLKSRIKRLS